MIKSYEWSYDQKEVIEYERSGSCNGCNGLTRCCKGKLVFQVIFPQGQEDEVTRAQGGGMATDGVGVWQGVVNDRKFVMRRLIEYLDNDEVCPNLIDGRCGSYELRGGYCEMFPVVPSDIVMLPECSYEFRKTRMWKIEAEDVS